jgi:hypothetical protein
VSSDRYEETVVELAKFTATLAQVSHEKNIDQHNATGRWLLASLFALNGGAILASINSSIIDKSTVLWSAPVFFVGILLAFVMAIMTQRSDRGMIAALSVWGLYWTQVASTKTRDDEQEKKIQRDIDVADRIGRKGRISGLISMFCFTVGCLITGLNLYR